MNIDPSALTLIQTSFLQHLQGAFATVAHYALNLLYLFTVLEVVIVGLMWAMDSSIAWGRFFFKIIKIGLIFFVIQNYDYLLATIINSFSQVAGITINNPKAASLVFNPATIWQYGYDAGLFLLQQAAKNASFGLTMVQCSLGMGILIAFGLLGIQIIVQVIGFYVVALVSLLMMPFGVFQPGAKMFDRAVHSILVSGVRVMALIMIVGIASLVWDKFSLTEMASSVVSINQPLGLFFTALLFLSLAYYLPRYAAFAVGSFDSSEKHEGAMVVRLGGEGGGAAAVVAASGDLENMRAASSVDANMPTAWGAANTAAVSQAAEVSGATRNAVYGTPGGMISGQSDFSQGGAISAQDILRQAGAMQKSISQDTLKKMRKIVEKMKEEV